MKRKVLIFNSIVLGACPVLAVYKWITGLTYDYGFFILLILLCSLTGLLKNNKSNDEKKLFAIIIICGFLSFFFNVGTRWFSVSLYINNLLLVIIAFFALIYLIPHIDIVIFKRTLIVIGIIASVICFIQILSVVTFGFFLPELTFIPGLEVRRGLETISMTRPCSIFTEPAHLCIYLAPLSYLMLVDGKKLLGFFFIASMICSTSTTGLLLSGIIIFMYMINSRKIKYIFYLGIAAILVFVILNNVFPTVIQGSIEKLSNTDADSDVRLLGPLSYIGLMDFHHFIAGVGINQLESFVLMNGGRLATEGSGNYANATLYMFFSYGIIGFIAFMWYLFKKAKRSQDKGFAIVCFAIICSDQILFSSRFLYLMIFMYYGSLLIVDERNKTLNKKIHV